MAFIHSNKLFKIGSLICAVLLTISCTPRGELQFAGVQTGTHQDILVSTMRARDHNGFSSNRSSQISYADFRVNIPATHEVGKIEWPVAEVNPETDFYVSNVKYLPNAQVFSEQINARASSLPAADREAVVFVHGYNTNFSEALYRFAQMGHDFETRGVNILYSWPSAGDGRGYVHDRDSVLFARSGLVKLIDQLEYSGVTRVTIVAHSIGSQLAVEAMREKALRDRNLWGKLDTVLLLSPDIDVELFRQQATEIGNLPNNFVIFTSGRDRVLRLSGWISSGEQLGSVGDINKISDLPVTVINGSIADGHFAFATSPMIIRLLKAMQNEQGFGISSTGGIQFSTNRQGLAIGVKLEDDE